MATTTLTNVAISEAYVSLLHSNGEILPATGQVAIYDGCGNESSIKIGRCSDNAGLTVCGPISASGTLTGDWSTLIDLIYPVGSVFFSADNVNPGTRFTGTTWTQISQGRFIAGVGTGNDGTDTHAVNPGADSGTGEYNHQLTVAEIPAHNHVFPGDDQLQLANGIGGWTNRSTATWRYDAFSNLSRTDARIYNTSDTGGSLSHNNIPPYYGLYVWRRTA